MAQVIARKGRLVALRSDDKLAAYPAGIVEHGVHFFGEALDLFCEARRIGQQREIPKDHVHLCTGRCSRTDVGFGRSSPSGIAPVCDDVPALCSESLRCSFADAGACSGHHGNTAFVLLNHAISALICAGEPDAWGAGGIGWTLTWIPE